MRKKVSEIILNMKTIFKVRGGVVGGAWSKTILLRFLILGPFPKGYYLGYEQQKSFFGGTNIILFTFI